MEDIRSQVPSQIASMLLSEERVYFYGSGKGCLSRTKSFITITDSRVIGAVELPGGCVSRKQVATVAIPLEHISSVKTASSGCLFSKVGTVVVSSGTANNVFQVGRPSDAQRATTMLQQAMTDVRKH
ncbi:MAG: hypothetical protein IT449_07730 [Phycisphaerales bacterium]|nr:hypothetical protein [Phycisphaerales bacterium]